MPVPSSLGSSSRGSSPTSSSLEKSQHGDYYKVLTPEVPGLDRERARIAKDIGHHLELTTDEYIKGLYNDLARRKEIEHSFLPQSNLYNVQASRWKGVAKITKSRDRLRIAILKVIGHVLQDYASEEQRECREIVDAHALRLEHDLKFDKYSLARWSQPDLIVTGLGPSFEVDEGRATYSNVATCIEVRTDAEEWEEEDEIFQLGIYAKQIFLQQPNRKFVRLLFMTESYVRFVHMDRAGCQYGDPIDYHEDPATLIQLIVGLSAVEEDRMGLDDTIRWRIKDGRKFNGYIRTVDSNGEPVWYPLMKLKPIAMHNTIFCRGMVVWKARTSTNRVPVIIKDAYHYAARGELQEHDYLAMVKGMDGVAQMISCEPGHTDLQDHRGPGIDGVRHALNLTPETRIVMTAYGMDISHFISEEQFLGALRDSIAGHQNIYWQFDEYDDHVGILHRDVSVANILLTDDPTPGRRGVLIDLDCAVIASELRGRERNSPVGTKYCKSIAVLRQGFEDRRSTWHGHIDDLESFFYVTCYLMFTTECPGKVKTRKPHFIAEWLILEGRCAAGAKINFFAPNDLDLAGLSSFWSSASRKLLQEYFKYMKRVQQKREAHRQLDKFDERIQHGYLCGRAPKHYVKVLGLFDEALETLRANKVTHMGASAIDPGLAGDPDIAPPSKAKKRKVNDDTEVPSAKKQKGGVE